MRRIRIFRSKGDAPSDLAEVLSELGDAGCGPDEVEIIDELGEPIEDCDEVIVFLLNEDGVSALEAADALSRVPKGGRRAICVWPKGASEFVLPEHVNNFSYSIVRCDPDRLKVAIADDDVTIFEGPTGQALPKLDTDHKECDE